VEAIDTSATPAAWVELLPGGDVAQANVGSHLVLEAGGGALLQALRLPEGLFALRGGRVRTFQVTRSLPSAAVVHYPPPLGPTCDAERMQAVERARGLAGLDAAEVSSRLERAGAAAHELAMGGEALVAELLCSLCTTGTARSWHVADAYRAERRRGTSAAEEQPAQERRPVSGAAAEAPSLNWRAPTPPTIPSPGTPSLPGQSERPPEQSTGAASPCQSVVGAEDSSSSLTTTIQEKALATALHLGLRGSAARVAGAVAAVGCEGYALYREIAEHGEQLGNRNISEDQFQERVCESAVSSSGRAIGGLAGAAAGQAAIPVPIVGAVVGGVLGAACGGLHANSLVRGAWRLSGAKAKGGEDLVRCVEHRPEGAEDLDSSVLAPEVPEPVVPRRQEAEQEHAVPQCVDGDEEGMLL